MRGTRLTNSVYHVRRVALACAWLVVAASMLSWSQTSTNDLWQTQSIYQIITDRFFDGDLSNNNAEGNYNPSGSSGTSVHGGDFAGIEQKLDYIKALGATAIWISPIVENRSGEFHGYSGRDFYKVAPHWGSLTDLQRMIQAAHARGILVINDIVANHGGDLIYSTDAGWSAFKAPPSGYNLRYRTSRQYAAPFNTNAINPSLTNLFHNSGAIGDYNVAQQVELGELSGLDDFRTETDYVRTNMAAIYKYWIAQGFDGFRIDTVKHVEMGFWQYWCPEIHSFAASIGKQDFFLFGESYDGSDAKCGSYTGTQGGGPFKMDSVVDYPLYFKVNSVFARATGNTKQIEDRYNEIAANYDPAAQMRLVTFLDNHDQARFLSSNNANNNTARLDVAVVFLYTGRGIPCLYYGTEQVFNGETDPYDREDMFDGQFEQGPSLGDNFNMTHPQFLAVARMNNLRRLYPAITAGAHVNKWYNPNGPGLFAYARALGSQEVFVVLNTSSTTQVLTNRPTSFAPGAAIVNVFDTNEVLAVSSDPLTPLISMPPTSAKVFVAQNQWLPLDPTVVSNAPAHDAASIPTQSKVVLKFSEPVETNSAQTSFRITPPTTGSFSWSAARDQLTFTPSGSGFPALTLITVRLTNIVSAVSGNELYAPYELRFKTAETGYADTEAPEIIFRTPLEGATIQGLLSVTGTANDNTAVQKIEIGLDGGSWQLAAGSNNWSFALNSSNFLNGPHQVSVRASDLAGNASVTNIAVRFENIPGDYAQRLSAGNSAAVTDCVGDIWLADRAYSFGSFGFVGGTGGYLANTISGVCTAAQPLYQRERYSTSGAGFSYFFDCPAGVYAIRLLEAETFWSNPGQRVFNVFIQGAQVASNLDILSTAGGKNIPLSLMFTNAVTNSQLHVQFSPIVDNARLSGIEARKIADVFSSNDGIPDWWRLAHFGHALPDPADGSRASDDPDDDGADNMQEWLAGTDPTNAASVFRIENILPAEGGIILSCLTAPNRTYQLLRSTSLASTSIWTAVGPAVEGNGEAIILSDGESSDSLRFYRVEANR